MKRNFRSSLLMFLPVPLILVVGLVIAYYLQKQHDELIAYYSHPLTAYLMLERDNTIRANDILQTNAQCHVAGGKGVYQWLIRGVLYGVDNRKPQFIWQDGPGVNNSNISTSISVSSSPDISDPDDLKKSGGQIDSNPQPSLKTEYTWRFNCTSIALKKVKMIVEAVAIPLPVKESELGDMSIDTMSVNTRAVTAAQIAAARKLSGAKYMKKSIVLDIQK